MHCARLDHFVRFNDTGTIGKCGHMVGAPGFVSWDEMQNSEWLSAVKGQMSRDQWPRECVRCQKTEELSGHSIRKDSLVRDQILAKIDPDYIILGGVLDNICNSACQSCSSRLSTKIGSLESRNYIKIDNHDLFSKIPGHHIVELDLNGGEPTASPRYRYLLENLPPSVKLIRVNTNGSRLLPNIKQILDQGISLIVTLSLDGTDKIHDYVRWPILWNDYQHTLDQYLELRRYYKNFRLQAWTTVHCLNVGDFENIIRFCQQKQIDHSWAWLESPDALSVKYKNQYTVAAKEKISLSQDPSINVMAQLISIGPDNQQELDGFIQAQDDLRTISIKDYL